MNQTRFLRLPEVMKRRARGRTSTYNDVNDCLLTEPVVIGPQAVAWPEHEIEAISRAQMAGKTLDEIRALVKQLHDARKVAA